MSIFAIPRAQTLRFVRTDNYMAEEQTFDNRLLMDEKWQQNEYIVEYLQKFNSNDPILIQLTTNYSPDYITIRMYNQDGTVDPNATFIKNVIYSYTDGSGNVVYNYKLDQSLVTFQGFKYIKIVASDPAQISVEYTSESFEFGDYKELPYFKWQNSDRDGIYWDEGGLTIFGFRCEIAQKYTPSSESSVYEGFTFQPETLFNVPKRQLEIESNPIPRYIAEKIELCFKHYNCWVNGISYSANGASAKIVKIDRVNLYNLSLTLLQVDYEDYSALQALSGDLIQIQPYRDYDNTFFVDFDKTKFYGQK